MRAAILALLFTACIPNPKVTVSTSSPYAVTGGAWSMPPLETSLMIFDADDCHPAGKGRWICKDMDPKWLHAIVSALTQKRACK